MLLAATSVEAAVRSMLAGRKAEATGRLRLDLPVSFEYGTTIPLGVAIDSPMTAADHVRRVAVFAEGNPFPEVASVEFSPTNGRADASTRIRLNEGIQEVVAVAELSDGTALLARQAIKVAISGCMRRERRRGRRSRCRRPSRGLNCHPRPYAARSSRSAP